MTTILALLSMLAVAPAGTPSPVPSRPAATPQALRLAPDELFSRRALRQDRLLIEMRMLQLRDERLECVREALLRQLPDALRPEAPRTSRGAGTQAIARCTELLQF